LGSGWAAVGDLDAEWDGACPSCELVWRQGGCEESFGREGVECSDCSYREPFYLLVKRLAENFISFLLDTDQEAFGRHSANV
jgi:hypothetical protein